MNKHQLNGHSFQNSNGFVKEKASNSNSNHVLTDLDNRKFSCFHVKAILVAGVGFLTDAYDLFSINLAVPMIGYVYFNGEVPTVSEAIIKGAATIGTFLGQLVFGILADVLGRKKMYGIELQLMIIGTFASALAANTVRGISMIYMLAFWRFVLGLGIGGDYPLSAIITSEYANVKQRGRMMAAVFAMQGVGILLASIVALSTLACFKNMIIEDPLNLDYVWRLCLGLGIVPATAAVYFRLTLPETPRFMMQVKGEHSPAKNEINSISSRISSSSESPANEHSSSTKHALKDFISHFGKWVNFKVLFGCAMSWFCLDVAFYGLQLNQSDVLSSMGYIPLNGTVYDKMFSNAAGNAMVSLMGTIPGYWFTVLLIEKMGRIKIQFMGFAVLTTVFIILSAAYYPIKGQPIALFIFIYCVGLFFFNFGPNTTTFIIPGEVFPTRFRSTGHGISAASGKLGSFIASMATPVLYKASGMQVVLGVFAGFMFLGILFTTLVPETKSKSLEQLSGDPTSVEE